MSLIAIQDLDNPGTAGNLLQQADFQRYPMAVDLQSYSPRFFAVECKDLWVAQKNCQLSNGEKIGNCNRLAITALK